jgi:hypothetical protein
MGKALVAIGTLLLAAVVGVYVLVVRPLLAPAEPTPAVEAALATPEVVLLAGVNVRQAAFVERWLLGARGTSVEQDTQAHSPDDRSLLDHLRAAGVDARHDLDYALYALYRTSGAELRHAVVLVGRFDPAGVESYLSRELHGVPRAAAGRLSHEITMISPADCHPAGTWIVTADRSWVIIADPTSHGVILSQLTGQATGESEQLAWWRSLARADLVSVGLWGVKDTDQAVTHPLQQGMAKTLSREAAAFAHLYFGLGARTVPPQGRLRLVLDAADPGAASQKLAGWQQALSQSRAQWSQTVPTVAALYDSLALRSEGARSTLEFTVDRTLAKNLQSVVNELLGAVFAGFGAKGPVQPSAPSAERIDPAPAVFRATISPAALGAYDPGVQFAEDVDQIQGPFGLRLTEVRLGSSDDVGLEMLVEGFANDIPNVTADGRGALLFVDSVASSAGQELLRPEPCGRERNEKPSPFTTSMARRIKAAKTLRLVPGADPHQLRSVSGHVELRLPTRTETVTMSRPAAGTRVERYGATFVITNVSAGTIAYQILGARDRVLHFRALNASSQPLSSGGAFSADLLFGDGVVGQKEYAGVVDRLEIVFAAEEQALRFPFTLGGFPLAGKPSTVARDATPPFQPYGYGALRRDHPRLPRPGQPGAMAVVRLEPFELALNKATPYFGTALEFTFRSPVIPNFERAFTVGRLRLTRVDLKDGTVLEPPATNAPARPLTITPVWDAPIRFGTTPTDGALTTSLRLFLGAKFEPTDIKALRGVITVELPRTLQTLSLNDLSPGQHAELGDFSVTVTARGRKSLTLRANKDGDRLLYTRLTSADGAPIAFFSPHLTVSPEGLWQFEVAPLGVPAAAEVIIAGERDSKVYPFTLVPAP